MDEEKMVNEFEKLNYYNEIFKYENPQENDVLQYLLESLKLVNENKINEKKFKYILNAYNHFINNLDYYKYFGKYNKINAKDKIFILIDLLNCDLFGDDIDIKRGEFFIKINEIIYIAKLSEKLLKPQITWEKKEIYIYNLYFEFVSFINSKLNYWKKIKSKYMDNVPLYKYYSNILKTEKDEKKIEDIKSKMENLNLLKGDFFNKYLYNLQEFIKGICDNLVYKFKYNDLNQEDDKLLLEDLFQFLSNYNFDFEFTDQRLINLWNETLKPMSNDEKKEFIKIFNECNIKGHINTIYELNGNTLKKQVKGKDNYIIDDIDDYDLLDLLNDLNRSNAKENYDYYLNKNLKINKYQTKLFMMKNKDYWIQLNVSILGTKSIEESMEFVHGDNYKNLKYKYLNDQEYLSKRIFNNIRFYIYKAKIGGSINKNSLRIYEYGLFSNNSNKSVSLLLFYSFNIITNIHEICGHYFINYYNSVKDKTCKVISSPNIEDSDYYDLYSIIAKERKRESGESIEIALFGRRIRQLTIKEALCIFESENYIKGRRYFAEKFNNCNSMEINEIISPFTKNLLSYFGIVFDDLLLNMNEVYKYDSLTNNIINSGDSFSYEILHPSENYCGNLTEDELNKIINYCRLIQEDLKLL